MKLIVTIDTEEDSWATYSPTVNPVKNIERLVPLQQLFDRYEVRPTYLVTYPVVTKPESMAILKRILDQGKCEIGMHCHPWNTPPFDEEINDFNSLLCNLPEPLVRSKLENLHNAIVHAFGITPVSFRAGRWGFSPAVARTLAELGYLVDSSVSPFVDWSEYFGPDYSNFPLHPYRFDPDEIKIPNERGSLMEIPATVGFLQNDFKGCQRLARALENGVLQKLRLKGLLSKLGVLNKAWLSPELNSSDDMIRLAKRLRGMQYPCLNMSFHSTSLLAGMSPFVQDRADEEKFIEKIEKFLIFSVEAGFQPVTLSQAC